MASAALPLALAHPSLTILLPARLDGPCAGTGQNEYCQQLNAATAALLERYTHDFITGIDCRTTSAQRVKLLQLISPSCQLRLGRLPDPVPGREYFYRFCADWVRKPHVSMRILSVHSDVQALKGTCTTFAITEVLSRAGIRMNGVQVFKWRLRSTEWLVHSIVAYRAQYSLGSLPDQDLPVIVLN